jgi:uncharacterized protein YjlB
VTTSSRGDVVVIPAGTGHQFTKIDDHISYLMVRIDPDKVTPHRPKRIQADCSPMAGRHRAAVPVPRLQPEEPVV